MSKYIFSPVEYILDELIERNWTINTFSEKAKMSPVFAKEIILGKLKLTKPWAEKVAKAFGTSSQLWTNLQDAYDSQLAP